MGPGLRIGRLRNEQDHGYAGLDHAARLYDHLESCAATRHYWLQAAPGKVPDPAPQQPAPAFFDKSWRPSDI
jgi:predicted anti-sigma-YlaC factor YlaD